MSPHFNEMASVARSYCELIESVDDADHSWLNEIATLLPRLHVAVSALGAEPDCPDHSVRVDLDDRFELYTSLRKQIGIRDSYWMEFDMAEGEHAMSGSLADDLTDIYYELKNCLHLLDDAESEVMENWRKGFHCHWGQHLVDAERHLYVLRSRNQL